MDSERQANIAHYLNGRTRGPGLEAVEGLRPALMAHYGDLASLRHDYPLVLVDSSVADPWVMSLAGLVDQISAAPEESLGGRRRRHAALRLEREVRRAVSTGGGGRLSALLADAATRLAASGDTTLEQDLAEIRKALPIDGQLVDCDQDLPTQLLRHIWQRVEARKTHLAFQGIDHLVRKLKDILRADDAASPEAQSPERLRSSFGESFTPDFDFVAMSDLLTSSRPAGGLAAGRRARIQRLLQVLETQRFFAVPEEHGGFGGGTATPYSFVFTSCSEAVQAFQARLPELSELASAMMMSDLEADGAYRPEVHDDLFGQGDGELGRSRSELTRFPSYLVVMRADRLSSSESGALIEAVASGLPIKVLLQTDDLCGPPPAGNSHSALGLDVQQVARAALSLGEAYVLQAASSHLYRSRDRIRRAMGYHGPALIATYSGAGGMLADLPPYLAAAAAMESRAFPAFVYDPSAGPDWASRCDVAGNPQPTETWPTHEIAFEDDALQCHRQRWAFTAVDFFACDLRHADLLACVAAEKWNDDMVAPAAELLAHDTPGMPDQVPYLLMVDPDGGVHRVLVGRQLQERARRVGEQWHMLRELGGVHNSFAERRVNEARADWEALRASEAEALRQQPEVATQAEAGGEADESAAAKPARRSDEAWIETARCSTCNECIQINDRMFKYNQNKQAVIADLAAGTYAQLVLAAERCQVAVIHPGKPRNPNEPDLEALLARAEPFL